MQLLVDTPTAEYYAGKEMVTIETEESGGFKNAYPFVILLSTLSRAVVWETDLSWARKEPTRIIITFV